MASITSAGRFPGLNNASAAPFGFPCAPNAQIGLAIWPAILHPVDDWCGITRLWQDEMRAMVQSYFTASLDRYVERLNDTGLPDRSLDLLRQELAAHESATEGQDDLSDLFLDPDDFRASAGLTDAQWAENAPSLRREMRKARRDQIRAKCKLQPGRCLTLVGTEGGVRNALYMPALVAIRHNLHLAETYRKLVDAGKPAKLAIAAIMRKLVILANALIRDDRTWAKTAP